MRDGKAESLLRVSSRNRQKNQKKGTMEHARCVEQEDGINARGK